MQVKSVFSWLLIITSPKFCVFWRFHRVWLGLLQTFLRQHRTKPMQCCPKAIPHKERLATLHAICLQISLESLFRIFPHASCVHIFRDISGKHSKIHKGFSPFFLSSLKKSDDAICIRQIRNRLSYFTKMLVNTSSIHSAFCFIWRKIWRRICRTIFVRYCLKNTKRHS